MTILRLAEANIGRIRASLEDPIMSGFVWRLQTDEGNATYLRPYEDDRILFNMSVWESLEHLRHFVYRTAHAEVLRRRGAWFEPCPAT